MQSNPAVPELQLFVNRNKQKVQSSRVFQGILYKSLSAKLTSRSHTSHFFWKLFAEGGISFSQTALDQGYQGLRDIIKMTGRARESCLVVSCFPFHDKSLTATRIISGQDNK